MKPLEAAFAAHRDSCEICRETAGPPQACPDGRRLHEAMVQAAHRERAERERGQR
jgi:hypothetical protein